MTIRIVGVHPDAELGEGEVRRIGLLPDVEDLAVVRLADVAEQVDHPRDRSRDGRDVLEEREPEITETDQPGGQPRRVTRQRRVVGEGQRILELGAPQRRAGNDATARGDVRAVPPQPGLVERRVEPLGHERHRHPVGIVGHIGDHDFGEAVDVERPLSPVTVTARFDVVPQPRRQEAPGRAVGEQDVDPLLIVFDCGDAHATPPKVVYSELSNGLYQNVTQVKDRVEVR